MNNFAFVGFSRIFLLGILIFKGLPARLLYKSLGVKGLTKTSRGNYLKVTQHRDSRKCDYLLLRVLKKFW
jgi:hypothetical protein